MYDQQKLILKNKIMEAHSVSYALANLKGEIVMFDISKNDLLKQFENKSDSLETGKYFIYECLHYNIGEKYNNTGEYCVKFWINVHKAKTNKRRNYNDMDSVFNDNRIDIN